MATRIFTGRIMAEPFKTGNQSRSSSSSNFMVRLRERGRRRERFQFAQNSLSPVSPSAQWLRVQVTGNHFRRGVLFGGVCHYIDPPEEVISSPPIMAGENSSLNWTDTNVVKKIPAPQAIRPGTPAARTNPSPAAPITTWTSLNRWAAENKIGQPHLISRTPVATYTIGTANGTMVLDIGSREATWNSVEIQLGFGPQFIDDQVFVHGLDLYKNLEPLL